MTTLNQAIEQYLQRGFGSMNKNDFEVFIFSYLLNARYKDKYDYDISIDLKIPISKIKRLRYEASLKYSQNSNEYKEEFIKAMKGARYEDTIVVFSIENIAFRQYLRNMLMSHSLFFDSSFNSDIVKVSSNDFLQLLEDLCLDKSTKKQIQKTINKNSGKDIPTLIIKGIAEIIGKTGGKAVEELADIGLKHTVDTLKSYFNKNNKN